VKKYRLAFSFLIVSLVIAFSCKKINEATELGGNLIPDVDNVKTFEVALTADATNSLFDDSVRVLYSDLLALGDINDAEFGNVHANFCFNVSSSTYGSYPYKPSHDSLGVVDSVVLSLSYAGAYGDTIGNGIQNISVYEIGQSAGFFDTVAYRYKDPASDFSGTLLGSKTYTINRLAADSAIVFTPGDTAVHKEGNVVRIRLNNSLGQKLMLFDAANNANGGYYNDSLFQILFPGLAVKSANSGNALSYFDLTDGDKTRLTVYYRYKNNNKDTVGAVNYTHSRFGQSNYVKTQPGSNWASAINNPAADKIYIQGAPSGAYGRIVIKGLDAMANKVIHRAELIAPRVASSDDNKYPPPQRLFLDRTNKGLPDTAFALTRDLIISESASGTTVEFDLFGGTIKSDDTYRFNITRYVQGIVTRHESNDTLRLYAPFEAIVYNPQHITSLGTIGGYMSLPVNNRIYPGRVVLAGGNFAADATRRLRLRIIYSDL
jgi:hypothetical protein